MRVQPLLASTLAHVIPGTLQVSVAATFAALVSQSGMLVGLQPILVLAGHLVNVGAVWSTVQMNTCWQVLVFLQASSAS